MAKETLGGGGGIIFVYINAAEGNMPTNSTNNPKGTEVNLYLNVFFIMWADRINRSLVTFKSILLCTRSSIPYLKFHNLVSNIFSSSTSANQAHVLKTYLNGFIITTSYHA